MKRTIIAVISMVLILFAFSACRPTVVGIPVDPTPDTPVTPPSNPSIPDYAIQVGDKTYQYLDDAIEAAPNGAIVEIGSGEFRIGSSIAITKNLTITGAGIDKTTITVSGGGAFTVTGDSFKISNLTISDESSDLTAFRSVINIGSTKATVDSVKITGGYSSTTENFRIVGIITNQNTESVTITNSRFEGFRVPIETDNDLANGAFAALIKGNTFEDFDKVTFEYREEGVTIEDNTFVLDSDTDKSFQISLDWKNGTITPEQAKAVAEANDCVVQVLRTEQSYDAEGAVISTVNQLKAFAAGEAGSDGKLVAPITVSETINFDKVVTLHGNDETITIAQSNNTNGAAFSINANDVKLDGLNFVGGDTAMTATSAPDAIMVGTGMTGFEISDSTFTGKFEAIKSGDTISDYNATMRMGIALQPGVEAVIDNVIMQYVYTPIQAYGSFTMKNVKFNSGINMNSTTGTDYSNLVIENCASLPGDLYEYTKGGKIVFNVDDSAKEAIRAKVSEWIAEDTGIEFYFETELITNE